MNDFPLNELLSTTDLDKIQESLVLIFATSTVNFVYHPTQSAEPFHSLKPSPATSTTNSSASSPPTDYPTHLTNPLSVCSHKHRLSSEPGLPKQGVHQRCSGRDEEEEQEIYSKRILHMPSCRGRDWRLQHEQLAVMTGPTKSLGGIGMELGRMDMERAKEAYELVMRIDVLDVSVGASSFFLLVVCGSLLTRFYFLKRAWKFG